MTNSVATGQLHTLVNVDDLKQIPLAWRQLYQHAAAPNVSLSPDLALPLVNTVLDEQPVNLLQSQLGKQLTGLLLLQRQQWRWGLLGSVLVSWNTPLTFSGTPLLHQKATAADVAQLLVSADAPLLLQAVACDSLFWQLLSQAAAINNTPFAILNTWQRAALLPSGSFQNWYDSNFDRKRRKEYRRLRNRLAESGQLVSASWSNTQPVQPWIDEFLALEAKGWKGQRGTALAAHEKIATCLSEALTVFAADNALRFWSLTHDGKTIASLFAFIAGDQVSLAKITYDESYAKYSPGVLLLLDATESLLTEGGLSLADSCAIPDHPMINNIWRDRIEFADILIGKAGQAVWIFNTLVKVELWRRQLREMAKSVYYFLTNRHRS